MGERDNFVSCARLSRKYVDARERSIGLPYKERLLLRGDSILGRDHFL